MSNVGDDDERLESTRPCLDDREEEENERKRSKDARQIRGEGKRETYPNGCRVTLAAKEGLGMAS